MAMGLAVESSLTGKQIIWGAPTYDQCRVGWREMQKAAAEVAVFNQSRMEATFPGGGSVTFRSLDDPDNARGHTADGVILDEAAMIPESAYYDVLRPIISDTQGWMLAIFTPKGRNWVWRECMRALDDGVESVFWQAPTLGVEIVDRKLIRKPHPMENPHFPFSEALSLYTNLPENTFQAEFLAQFLEGQGAVFRYVDDRCTAAKREPYAGDFTFGLDWAQSHDYTVCVVMDGATKTVVDYDRFNGVDWSLQRGRIKALYDRWKPNTIIAESNSIGSPNIEALRAEGLPIRSFETTAVSKPPLIESLVLAFDRGEITALNDPIMKGELMAYERKVGSTGRSQYSAPAGLHDDVVMALALAWHGCVNRGGAVAIDDW